MKILVQWATCFLGLPLFLGAIAGLFWLVTWGLEHHPWPTSAVLWALFSLLVVVMPAPRPFCGKRVPE